MAKRHPIPVRLGQNVRARRLELGLSQEKLSFESELDRSFIGHIERGSRKITVVSLCKVARALKVKPGDLLKGIR